MRRVSKTLAGALVVFLLALGLAACGGGSDSGSSPSTEATAPTGSGSSTAESPTSQGREGKSEGEGTGEEPASRKSEASEFTPKSHNDSGGGSTQYKVKGGDNSVQEFGEEAEPKEFDAAAAALHDFLDARAEGNWAAACDYMSKAVTESFEKLAAQAKQIEDKSCAGILEKLTNPAAKSEMKAEAEKANVGSLRTEGDRSFVIYTGIKGTVLAMPMANEGGEWKVASLAGTPLS
ncbi:MAG TPA: hypothetical protein VFN89_03615 [Solirubrobacterales bacterium]|nr:hypothetical protein [Solirubrobacterales bacterium]